MSQRAFPAGFIAPSLPTKTDKLPSGDLWLHEIKHDVIAGAAVEPHAVGMCGGEARSRGGLGKMTHRKREIVGLRNNGTSRIWSKSHFRRKVFAAFC
jgi:hypothetical protein